jgi:hypothetical protein
MLKWHRKKKGMITSGETFSTERRKKRIGEEI